MARKQGSSKIGNTLPLIEDVVVTVSKEGDQQIMTSNRGNAKNVTLEIVAPEEEYNDDEGRDDAAETEGTPLPNYTPAIVYQEDGITPDFQATMAQMTPLQLASLKKIAATAAKEKKSDNKPLSKKEAALRATASFKLYSEDAKLLDENGEMEVSISELISLDKTPVRFAKYAMREVSKDQALNYFLAYKRGDKFPAINVQPSTMGLIVWDGYHRWDAQEQVLAEDVPADKLLEVRNNSKVRVKLSNFTKDRELIDAAFAANTKNGLPMSVGSRTRYAIYLLNCAKDDGVKLSMRRAALLAGVTHPAVSQMLDRDARGDVKMLDTLLTPDEVEEVQAIVEAVDTKDEVDQLARATKVLFGAAKTIVRLNDKPAQLAKYLTDFIVDKETAQIVTVITMGLQQANTLFDHKAVQSGATL